MKTGTVKSRRRKPVMQFVPPNRIRLGNRHAVADILWQPVREGLSIQDQVNLASGQRSNLDLFTTFGDGRQFGFARTGDGTGNGMLAAASVIDRDRMGNSWLASFALDEGGPWWIVAMRSGLIYEDRICADLSKARSLHSELSGAPDWELVVAPEDWQIRSADGRLLPDVLDIASAARLRPINRVRRHATRAAALCLSCAIGYLCWAYLPDLIQRFQTPSPDPIPESRVEVMTAPWEDRPGLAAFSSLCTQHIDRLFIAIAGWKSRSVSCLLTEDGISLRSEWKRQGGRPGLLKRAILERTGVRVRTECGGQCINFSEAVPLPGRAGDSLRPPWPSEVVDKIILERFQSLGLQLAMQNQPMRLAVETGDVARIQRFGHHDITITTSAAVDEYARLLSDVPALVPESLVYTPDARAWTVTAKVYHLPPPRYWQPGSIQ